MCPRTVSRPSTTNSVDGLDTGRLLLVPSRTQYFQRDPRAGRGRLGLLYLCPGDHRPISYEIDQTPTCRQNHHSYYRRSEDLAGRKWEVANGPAASPAMIDPDRLDKASAHLRWVRVGAACFAHCRRVAAARVAVRIGGEKKRQAPGRDDCANSRRASSGVAQAASDAVDRQQADPLEPRVGRVAAGTPAAQ